MVTRRKRRLETPWPGRQRLERVKCFPGSLGFWDIAAPTGLATPGGERYEEDFFVAADERFAEVAR